MIAEQEMTAAEAAEREESRLRAEELAWLDEHEGEIEDKDERDQEYEPWLWRPGTRH